jgi:CRISPR/Cas system Type II protein with McrA/HNH and RuvC-like nuclease domain
MFLMHSLMRTPQYGKSIEFSDNRISLFSAQWGKCAVTGHEFTTTADICCHHIVPQEQGGSDKFGNLVLVTEHIHRLIHAVQPDAITEYRARAEFSKEQLAKVNALRAKAKLPPIA